MILSNFYRVPLPKYQKNISIFLKQGERRDGTESRFTAMNSTINDDPYGQNYLSRSHYRENLTNRDINFTATQSPTFWYTDLET
jgi:hypothetical protein